MLSTRQRWCSSWKKNFLDGTLKIQDRLHDAADKVPTVMDHVRWPLEKPYKVGDSPPRPDLIGLKRKLLP